MASSPVVITTPPDFDALSEGRAQSPRRADSSLILALFVSLVLHAGLLAWALSSGAGWAEPSIAIQAGRGGDSVSSGQPLSVEPAPEPVFSAIPAPPSSSDANVGEQTETVFPEPESAFGAHRASPLAAPMDWLSATDAGGWIGPLAVSGVPMPALPTARRLIGGSSGRNLTVSAEAFDTAGGAVQAEAGDGGQGGDELASRAPVASARNRPPRYPAEARRQRHEGTVTLEVAVLSSGRVEAINVVNSSGHRSLDEAAMDAVRDWVFNPASASGRLSACRIRLPVRFVLRP